MDHFAEFFYKYDYTETKDLLKSFLTLSSGTLVLSVTFSEKIVDYHRASRAAKVIVLSAWLSIAISIISAGISMTFIAAAVGKAIYGGNLISFMYLAKISWAFIIIAGSFYICGLLLIISAAAIRIFDF